MSLESKYNKIYSEDEHAFGFGQPEKLVKNLLKFKTSGSALELGAGEGRNSIFLAKNGFQTTAQDISQIGLDRIDETAIKNNLNIKTELKDIRSLDSSEQYDVLICTFVLHHLTRDEALKTIKQIQQNTNPEGLNLIISFTKNGDFFKENINTEKFYLELNELKDLYADWDILEYEETKGEARRQKPDGTPMFNISAKILAKKIKTAND
jgi:tellurite methyltransferase